MGRTMAFIAMMLVIPFQSLATSKVDFSAGMFNLKASNSRGESSLSSLGSYMISYRRPFWSQFEIQLGYSLIASQIYTGDLGFGPDLGVIYFPLTLSGSAGAKSENVQLEWTEYYKPYIGASFDQRQYQSTQSNYAGFGVFGGLEYFIKQSLSIRADVRMIQLIGPSQSKATELDIMFGISVPLAQ